MADGSSNTGKTDVTLDDLAKQLEILKSDIAHLTSTAGDYGRSRAADARAEGEAQVERARQRALEFGEDVERFAKEQPGLTLGLAAGVGFVVGWLMSRR